MVGTIEIQKYERYITRMSKSMPDKLFWVNKVAPDIIVDFGCANGELLRQIASTFDCHLVGYDMDETMLLSAKDVDAYFTDDWEEVKEIVKEYERPLLILSSVIHEVYSYSSDEGVLKFWANVFDNSWKWISIRDMIYDHRCENDYDHDAYTKVLQHGDKNAIKMFEENWGPLNSNYKNLIHFLLKYRYDNNFDREMPENYLPLSLFDLGQLIPPNYKSIYSEHEVLPWIFQKVKEDFDIEIKYPTHMKLIIERMD